MENLKLYENFISDREDMINEAKKSEKGLMVDKFINKLKVQP